MKQLTPRNDRVVLRPVREEITKGGIIIAGADKERPETAEVVAVGPGQLKDNGSREKIELSKGDKVLFSKYSGTEVELEGEEYIICRESDVLAVLS